MTNILTFEEAAALIREVRSMIRAAEEWHSPEPVRAALLAWHLASLRQHERTLIRFVVAGMTAAPSPESPR